MLEPSVRAEVITRRTYNRPLNVEGTIFETWEETVDRVIRHQKWLWERSIGGTLSTDQQGELEELKNLILIRKIAPAGRVLWLGGTDTGMSRETSMFNCSFLKVQTVYDCVDCLWLLLNGCGVGFYPQIGTLNGFSHRILDVEFKTADNSPSFRGMETNEETFEDGVWTIKVGDSAKAWSKVIGKLLARKHKVRKLVIDTTEIRGPGDRLKGYGWICAGAAPLIRALKGIITLMNRKAGHLLTRIDILDLVAWLGTVLSTRRSALICLFNIEEPEWREFAVAKKDCDDENPQRWQSNNSLMFNQKPTRERLKEVFSLMASAGGSEPGFFNADAARKRAPWFSGTNPCGEVLLPDKGFCNLSEVDISKFKGDHSGLHRAVYLISRANYRQTCVNLRDGVLQEAWQLNNDFLRLCGVGLTGLAKRPDFQEYDYQSLQRIATSAAIGMALELGTPLPKNITLMKPSGTMSKIMDTTEGAHRPLGKYILNNINFSKHDPLVDALRMANYKVIDNPVDPEAVLVTFPVKYDDVEFDVINSIEVNNESAVDQLERYKLLQIYWTQQNTSITISYDLEEVPSIIDWLLDNWDYYVGVSFCYREDPFKTPEDLGYKYLPQEVVTQEVWEEYNSKLNAVDINQYNSHEEIKDEECPNGFCPVK